MWVMWHAYLTWYMSLPKIIKLSQTVWELWSAQDFGIRGDEYIMGKGRVLLNTTCLLVLIYASTKYYQNISNPHTQEFGVEIHSREVTRKQTQQWLSFLQVTCLLVFIYMPLQYKIFQTIKKSLSAQGFGLEIYSVECRRKRTKQELSFLHVTLLLDLIYIPPKYYQIISDSMGVIACTRFQL